MGSVLLSGQGPGLGEEGGVRKGPGAHRALLLGGPKTWSLDKETEARGERAWPQTLRASDGLDWTPDLAKEQPCQGSHPLQPVKEGSGGTR